MCTSKRTPEIEKPHVIRTEVSIERRKSSRHLYELFRDMVEVLDCLLIFHESLCTTNYPITSNPLRGTLVQRFDTNTGGIDRTGESTTTVDPSVFRNRGDTLYFIRGLLEGRSVHPFRFVFLHFNEGTIYLRMFLCPCFVVSCLF